VIPQMNDSREADWQELLSWIHDLRRVNACPTVALPYILLQRPYEIESFCELIKADLNTDNEDQVAAAAKALRHWVHLSAQARIPKPDPNLMKALIERVILRRKSGIFSCLHELAFLITEKPREITAFQVELIVASLVPWYQATILPLPD